MMRNRFLIGVLCSMMLAFSATKAEEAPLPLSVYLFDPCGQCAGVWGCGECDIEIELYSKIGVQLREYINAGQVRVTLRNIRDGAMERMYKEHLAEFHQPDEKLPVFIVGEKEYGTFLSGEEALRALPDAIDAALQRRKDAGLEKEAALQREQEQNQDTQAAQEKNEEVSLQNVSAVTEIAKGDSTLIYIYKPDCPYCIALRALMEAIPETVTLPDGQKSRVRFLALNKDDPIDKAIVDDYYETMEISKNRQLVPMVIIGEKDLFLYDEIVPTLLVELLNGSGLHTELEPLMQAQSKGET